MKMTLDLHLRLKFVTAAVLLLFGLNHPWNASAQGTSFTYQGLLQNSNGPVGGTYNLTFSLYANSTGGSVLAGPVTNNGVAISNGLFTVPIDFGSGSWNGQTNWLQLGVESNGDTSFSQLSPRQRVTPVPYAIFAEGGNVAGLTGQIKNSQLANSSITVNAGTALTGGGTVALGGSTTINNAGVTSLTGGGGVTVSASTGALTLGSTATSADTANAIVSRDASGNFSAGSITLAGTLNLPALPLSINAGPYLLLFGNSVDQSFGVGPAAGNLGMTGTYNTAVGFQPMEFATSGSYDTALGAAALENIGSGSFSTAAGAFALFVNGTNNNTAVGYAALYQDVTGNNNTAVGFEAIENSPGDNGLVAVGFQALQNDNAAYFGGIIGNTAIGYQALRFNTNAVDNTAEGYQALSLNTSGDYNTAQGYRALYANTTGVGNTANGDQALAANTTGSGNTADGSSALWQNITGGNNTASGLNALSSNTNGNNNTAYGYYSMYNLNNGNNNTAVGVNADSQVFSGNGNTAVGSGALGAGSPGSATMDRNTAVGTDSLEDLFQGDDNTVLGWGADQNETNGIENIAIGYQAGNNLVDGSSNIVIGNLGQATDNNVIRIGTEGIQTDTVIAGIYGATASGGTPVYVDSSGRLGTMTSSAKFKRDIQPMGEASDVLLKLRPVTFKYKPDIDPKGAPQFGLVAEDVDRVDPDLVVRDQNHRIYSVRYEAVNAMLLNEFLKQHQTVEDQHAQLENQSAEIADLKKENVSLAQRLDALEAALVAAPPAIKREKF